MIFTVLGILALFSWVSAVVFGIIWKKQDEEFINFLNSNSSRLRSGESCEFKGVYYTFNTPLLRYTYCYSVLVMTFTRSSALRPASDSINERVICTLITLFGGWWGFPWGPVYSIKSFVDNISPQQITVYDLFNQS